MSDSLTDAPGAHHRATELSAVIVLGIAALASSYAAFQSEVWHGEQASHYTLAEQERTDASTHSALAAELRTLDANLFSQWLDAYAHHDRQLEQFYRTRFRPDFTRIFDQWLLTHPAVNPKAPLSPFHMRAYSRATQAQVQHLTALADRDYAAGRHSDEVANQYVQGTVILALSLFLGGVTQGFQSKRLRTSLLIIAAVFCLLGIVRLLTLPALRIAL